MHIPAMFDSIISLHLEEYAKWFYLPIYFISLKILLLSAIDLYKFESATWIINTLTMLECAAS